MEWVKETSNFKRIRLVNEFLERKLKKRKENLIKILAIISLALRPEDLLRGVSFPIGVAAWIWPKRYSLVYWCNRMQISTHSSFDLCNSGVRQQSTLAYT